jgi:dihydroneopterin aldolase
VTGFLASVRTAAEAAVAVAGGADIIDAKEPAQGALGRLDEGSLRAVLGEVAGARPVSATIGDVVLAPKPVREAVLDTAAVGVDIVKIGIFDGDLQETLDALAPIAVSGVRLVAVLFADRRPAFAATVDACAAAGFYGVMLDTAVKSNGPLTCHFNRQALAEFVTRARRAGLVCGLAGSLRRDDIPLLAPLGADYLGFRSALTSGTRTDGLAPEAVRAVRYAIDAASRPTATAGAMSAAAGERSGEAMGIVLSKAR